LYKANLQKHCNETITAGCNYYSRIITWWSSNLALIQSADATGVNTTRSNIKSAAKKELRGNDNQVNEQDSNVNQYSIVENNCGGDGAECSGSATNTIGDIQSPKSEVSVSVGNENPFEGDPVPDIDVKVGNNPR
jgi:hypothetical protein